MNVYSIPGCYTVICWCNLDPEGLICIIDDDHLKNGNNA